MGFGTNMDNAQFEVQQRVAQILSALPPGVQQPTINKFDVTDMPVAQVSVSSDHLDERELRDLAYNVIEPQLERIPGVASASVGGGKTREIGIRINRNSLFARGLSILDVIGAVRSSNLLLPSGNLRALDRDYNVFSNAQIKGVTELNDVVVRAAQPNVGSTLMASTSSVRISDIAKGHR